MNVEAVRERLEFRSTNRLILTACVLVLVGSLACRVCPAQVVAGNSPQSAADGGLEFFQQQIAPLLKRRCYSCHSHEAGKASGGLVLDSRRGWEQGGNAGPALVPGKPDESLLLQAVRYQSYEMPPQGKLPDQEIALLEKWIAMGAPDPRQDRASETDSKRLWALQPIARPVVPTVGDPLWAQDRLDAFILAELEANGLEPAADADRHTLLRRVTFDLTGLPPTPEAIAAFINDPSERAYEQVVDRLLDSPAFGDHWARHWFDLSCYADLADIQGNVLIRDAWRYRDYVIAAFNTDKPLDRFIHEQIAGDLLPADNAARKREQIIATGYLAIGPWTLQNYIKKQLDADVVDHQIDRIGRTFLGQTVGCARCHNHKFDPLPTADYYALAGIFRSTLTTRFDGPGVWSVINQVRLPELPGRSEEDALRQRELGRLRARRQTLQAELTNVLLTIPGGSDANVLTLEKPIPANERGRVYEVTFAAGPSVWAAAAQRTTAADGLQVDLLRDDGSVLAGWRYDPGPWSGTKDAQKLSPVRFSYTGDGSGGVRFRMSTATPGNSRFGGAIDQLKIAAGKETLYFEDFSGLRRGPIEGVQADTGLPVLAGASVPGWSGGGLNHTHAVELQVGDYAIQFFGGAQVLTQAKPLTQVERQAHAQAVELQAQLQSVANRMAELEREDAPEHALAVRDVDEPADGPIYRRGDFENLGAIVPRGFLAAIPCSSNYSIPPDASGRLQLARWLTDPENPLTSRVLVNRIWHHLFGQGLVRTVDYFGAQGEAPSHPQLLDFLATRLRDNDRWSLKRTVRRMVLSRTYQMASTHNDLAARVDPDNRLMWRMPRRRLAGESIRDAMLAASGLLDPARGGPSLGLELEGNIVGLGGNVNPPTWGGKISPSISNRRSVYLPLRRERPQGELEILTAFDFPHPNDITGARPKTTVATQALFLMNAPFVRTQAEALARRLESYHPPSDAFAGDELAGDVARIRRLYLLTVSRPPSSDEIELTLAFLERCAADFNGDRPAAWRQLCHAVLGSNSFLFRE